MPLLEATTEREHPAGGYRCSHARAGKAREYDVHFLHRYRAYLWEREQKLLRRILDRHFPNGGVDCLDFACGTGRILRFLETVTDRTTGVDVSAEMLSAAKQKLRRTELVQGDITLESVFGDRRFNLITAFRFFLNAEAELRREAIHALAGLLTPDGLLVFNNHMNRFSAAGFVTRASNRLRGGNNKTWRIRDMRALVCEAGLRVLQIEHVGVMPGWERYMILPAGCYRAIESVTSRIGALRHVAQDVLFVCGKSA